MRFFKKFILLLLSLTFLCPSVNAEVVDKIIAVVNDEVITLYELNTAFEPYRKNIENTYKGSDKDKLIIQAKEEFFQRLIDNMLIEQEARKTGISATVKEEDVMGVLQDMLTKQHVTMQEFLKNLAQEGGSIETVKKEIRSQMIRMRLLRREVKDKIIVSDEEIGEYYNKHRDEYEGRESVRMKQIFLMLPENADNHTKMKMKKEAVQLRERIIKGESFDGLAAKYSQGPAAATGGDVGFIERGTIIPEVENIAFGLPVDQVSEVIESSKGFYIVKVVDKKGGGLKPVAVVRDEIKAKIEDEKLDIKFGEWIDSLRAKSHVDIRY